MLAGWLAMLAVIVWLAAAEGPLNSQPKGIATEQKSTDCQRLTLCHRGVEARSGEGSATKSIAGAQAVWHEP